MKKISLIALTLVLSISTFAQSAKYSVPNHVVLPLEKDTTTENYRGDLYEKFYPIGFSRDGKFAYYAEPPDEACGCYFARFVIQDLKTDRILYSHRNFGEGREEPPEQTIEGYWKKLKRTFEAQLRKHRIIPGSAGDFQASSIQYRGDVFTPDIDVELTILDVYSVRGMIEVFMKSREKGEKSIYKRIFDPKKVTGFRGARVSGSLVSPFEPRAAVVVTEILRGWEGPPNTTRIRIVGADLRSRFKKASG